VIPPIGFGTWRLSGRDCEEGVADALVAGYRHIDTAAMYDNEDEVGRGLRGSGVDRSEVWLTTKVWIDALEPEELRVSLERSLRRLGVDQVELLLMHWPNPAVPLESSLAAMTELRAEGKTREIGVSNFPSALFTEALDLAPVIVNQVEYHPFLSADAVLEVCEQRDVELTAYRPLAKGKVDEEPVIRQIAAAHGKTPAQVALRWLIEQPRVGAVPRSSSAQRRRENLDVFDFELSAEETARIDALPKDRREVNVAWAPEWD
jgi:2,5-diketo-D-gluconate reductase B